MVCGLARRWPISRSVLFRARNNTDYPEAVVIPMNHVGLLLAGLFRPVGSG